MKYIVVIIALVTLTLTSCLKEKAAPILEVVEIPCGDTVFFSTQIFDDIITPNCSSCHTNGSSCGGYDLGSHANLVTHADKVLQTLKHENGVSPMPQGSPKLNDSLITLFDCWIQQGKLNN